MDQAAEAIASVDALGRVGADEMESLVRHLLQLASFFDETVGMDPEPDMLREAARLAAETGVRNVEWVCGASTDLPALRFQLGRVDLVTIGTAFHWMDAHATLETLRHIVRRGGSVVVAYNGSPMWLHPTPWVRGAATRSGVVVRSAGG